MAGKPMDLEQRTLALGAQAIYRDPALYEQLYLRRRQDVRFYVELAKRLGGPVLEIGSGSGRITRALAAEGLEVTGIEPMRVMRDYARTRLPAGARVVLRAGDVRRLALAQRFALVIAPFNVLQHLYTHEDLVRGLRVCAQHLATAGRLAFDVLLPDVRALAQDPDRAYRVGRLTHPLTKKRYTLRESSHYEPIAQVRTAHMFLEPDGTTDPAIVIPLAQRQIFPEELRTLLASSGLTIERCYGDFDGTPLASHSPSQIVIARLASRRARGGATR
jgi:SAM-dependent methyltransferase